MVIHEGLVKKIFENVECKICARNGTPGINVDIEYIDKTNPETGKDFVNFFAPNTVKAARFEHEHHENPNKQQKFIPFKKKQFVSNDTLNTKLDQLLDHFGIHY